MNIRRGKEEEIIEQSPDRIAIMKKIEELERQGKFDVDPEEDPPTIELTPDKVDYLKEKSTSKLKAMVANTIGEKFLDDLLRKNKLIIKQIKGLENLNKIESGAMITCNHFNPFDSFTIEEVFRTSKQSDKKLYKIIREGNYTNFPGFYGYLFRNCDTLPLSSNTKTMSKLLRAVDEILQSGNFILIYPEQSLWWNYKKPKPLKSGAYRLATRNHVPVVPVFITMEDSDIMGPDGFMIQEYIVNICEPIYPDEKLTEKENTVVMKDRNFEVWKKVYEDFYGIPLKYTTEKEVVEK